MAIGRPAVLLARLTPAAAQALARIDRLEARIDELHAAGDWNHKLFLEYEYLCDAIFATRVDPLLGPVVCLRAEALALGHGAA